MKHLFACILIFALFAIAAAGQTTTATTSDTTATSSSTSATALTTDQTAKYAVLFGGGYGPGSGATSSVGFSARLAKDLFGSGQWGVKGGANALEADLLYRLGQNRGLTLYGRGGGGYEVQSNTVSGGASTNPTFGGGFSLGYDLSKISTKLSGFELFATVRVTSTTSDITTDTGTQTVTNYKMKYGLALKFNFNEF